MRRAFFILIAVLFAATLVYPTTMPSAKTSLSSNDKDSPSIITTPDVPPGPGFSGDGEEGDGDSVAGYRGGDPTRGPGGASTFGIDGLAKGWWSYLLFLQLRVGL